MNRNLRRSTWLLAGPVVAVALSLALAGPPPAPLPADPGPASGVGLPDLGYTDAQRETVRGQLLETLARMGDVAAAVQPGVFDQSIAEAITMVEEYDDDALNVLLASGADFGAVKAQAMTLQSTFAQLPGGDDGAADEEGPGDSAGFPDPEYSTLGGTTRPHWGFKVAAFTLKNISVLASDTADRVCQQTWYVPFVGSFDCSVCCLPTWLILKVAEAALEFINFKVGDITSAELEATFKRTCHLHNDILFAQGQQDEMDAKVTALLFKLDDLAQATEILRETSCEHIRLVQLPQERRTSDLRQCPQ